MLLWLCMLWIFVSVVVATLPMRWQYLPGSFLLLAAPVLIVMIAQTVGFWVALAGTVAFVSMYRNPLRYVWKRLTGQNVELPQ
jgi:hypothetical protein